MADYLPRRDGLLAEWTGCFVRSVSPPAHDPTAFGLSASQVAELDAAQRAFAEALAILRDPERRTSPAVTRKDTARRRLVALIRPAAQTVQHHPGTMDVTRVELGLTVPKGKAVRAVAVPIEGPRVSVKPGGNEKTVALSVRRAFDAQGLGGPRGPRGVCGSTP